MAPTAVTARARWLLQCLGLWSLLAAVVEAGPPYAQLPDALSPTATFKLRDGHTMPIIGVGVHEARTAEDTYNAVKWALEAGCRMIDTAALHGHEESVGKAIIDSGIPRAELFISTKLRGADHGYSQAVKAFETSLKRLKLDYVDLYLIQSPNTGQLVPTWDALVHVQRQGKARSIGVGGFDVNHMDALKTHGRPLPVVNQLDLHPLNTKDKTKVLEYCQKNKILVQAYGSLVFGYQQLLEREELAGIVAAHPQSTPSQVLVRWALHMGLQSLPRALTKEHMEEALKALNLELTKDEVDVVHAMKEKVNQYWNQKAGGRLSSEL